MALAINAQFDKFVQFAQQQPNAATSKAIARVTGNEDALAGRSISASTTDHVRGVFSWGGRSDADAARNNETRRLFLKSVADIFGGEGNIPKAVKDVMKLEDYGTAEKPLGKPLTARRIMAVKAEVDKIVAAHAEFNDGVVDKIVHAKFNELPQEFQTGLREIVDDLRVVFGEAAVPKNKTLSDILNPRFVKNTLEGLRDVQPDFTGKEYLLERQLKPEARRDIIEALSKAGIHPTSMMDISDGLSSELMHICSQSHTGCRVYEERIPLDYQTAVMAEEFNMNVTTCALNGGEDYELLFTVPLSDNDRISQIDDVKVIGYITQAELGCALITRDGKEFELKSQGWNPLKG